MGLPDGRSATWRGAVALLALVVLVAVSAAPAAANHTTYATPENKLGWSACAWPTAAAVTVGIDPGYPFPSPTFADRLGEAVTRWNEVLATSNRGVGLALASPGAAPDVVVQYRAPDVPADTDSNSVLAETYLQRQGDPDASPDIRRCPSREPSRYTMAMAVIKMSPRDDWYTGPDSETDMWQMCGGERFAAANQAFCSDQVDFASTMIHELGHTLVLYHPQTLDDLDGVPFDRSDSASTAAKCWEATGAFEGQATMCSSQGKWRAEQRTLTDWDVESAHRLYS